MCVRFENKDAHVDDTETATLDVIHLSADIVAAFVSNNSLPASELAGLLINVHAAVDRLTKGEAAPPTEDEVDKPTPAQVRKSISPDALISFVDGKSYKTLKRHLGTHGLDMQSYRARYGLPSDYPSVAPNYSAARSALAKNIGLGQVRRDDTPAAAKNAAPSPSISDKPKRGRPAKKNA